MTPIFFKDKNEFRKWLEKNHKTETELVVGFYKVSSGRANMSWSESVDEALCFGWIDGIRRSVDDERYSIRFTPRKNTSIWSNINLRKVEQLKNKGLMKQAGLDVYNNRRISNSGIYSFEKDTEKLSEVFDSMFKANQHAWEFFRKQAPSYQKTILNWIMSAKQETTRLSRLTKAIIASENQKRIF